MQMQERWKAQMEAASDAHRVRLDAHTEDIAQIRKDISWLKKVAYIAFGAIVSNAPNVAYEMISQWMGA